MNSPSHAISLNNPLTLRHLSTGRYAAPFVFDAGGGDFWLFHLHFTQIMCDYLGRTYTIPAGHASLFPPQQAYQVYGEDRQTHIWHSCHFHLATSEDTAMRLPIVIDLETHFGAFDQVFRGAIGHWAATPMRSQIMIWDMLWQMSDLVGAAHHPEKPLHPALNRAIQIIEQRLHEPLSVHGLAEETGMSHNQLTRLFQKSQGCTAIHYIRQRRVSRAEYLITQTSLPFKVIATQVGLSDPHVFNKVIRQETGQSPTALRGRR
jgi:AraC-like DNA-binding protein